MKTIIARFTELKNNVSAAESEFEDLDYNKVDKALKSVGISLKDSMGQFRNLDDVFLELSEKWDTLDRNAQRYIATTAAGSRQQSRFLAMMENYDRTLELIETAQNSVGRSSEQFAKYQDTIESKIKRLKTSWEKLRVSMLDPNKYKGAIEALTKIVEKLNKMDIKQIAAIGVTFATVGKKIVESLIKSIQGSTSKISEALSQPINTSYKQVSKFMVDGIETTVKSIKETYPKLNSELIQILGKSNQEINADLLNKLNSLTPAARQLAQEFMEGAGELKRQNDKLVEQKANYEELVKKVKNKYGEDADVDIILKEQNDKLKEQMALVDQLKEKQGNRAKNLRNEGLTDNQLVTLVGAGENQSDSQIQNSLKTRASEIFAGTGKELGSAFAGVLTTTISSALIGSLTTVISGGSFEEAIKNAGKTVLITALPQAISSVAGVLVPKLITLFTTTILGPVALGVGALIGGILLKSYLDSNGSLKAAQKIHEQAEKEFEEAKEKYTAIKQMVDEDEKQVKEQNEKVKNLDEQVERYKELIKINNLTTEEQEEYNELINNLKDELPELEDFYNERNNKLTISNAKLDEMLKKEKAIARQKTALYYADQISEVQAERKVLSAENKEAYASIDEQMEERRKALDSDTQFKNAWIESKINELSYDNKGNKINAEYQELASQANIEWQSHLDETIRKEREEQLLVIDEEFNKQLKESAEKLNKLIDGAIDAEFSDESPFYRNLIKKNAGTVANYRSKAEQELLSKATDKNGDLLNYTKQTNFSAMGALQTEMINLYGSREAALEYFNTFKETISDSANFTQALVEDLTIKKAEIMALDAANVFDESIPEKLKEQFSKDVEKYYTLAPAAFNEAIQDANWESLETDTYSEDDIKKDLKQQFYKERADLLNQSGIKFLTSGSIGYDAEGAYDKGIFSSRDLAKLTNEELISLNNFVDEKITQLGRDTAEKYLKSMAEAMGEGNLDISQQTQIINFLDWDQMDASNLDEWKKKFFEFYQSNIDETAENAKTDSLFDKLLEDAKDANLYEPLIKDFENYEKTIKEGYEELEKNAGLMKSIALEGENALIDQSTLDNFQDLLDKMYEANNLSQEHTVDEFFTWDAEKGAYTVSNAERLEKVWDKMSKSKLKDIANDALAGFDASIKGVEGNFENARKAIEKLAEKGEINEEEWKAIKAYSEKTGSQFYKLLQDTKNWDKSLKNAQDTTKEIQENIKKSRDTISSLISDVSGAAENMLEKGKINYSDLTGLSDTMEELAKSDENFTLSLSNYYDKLNQTFNYKKWIADMRAYLQMRIQIYGQNERDIALLAELNAMEQELIDKEAELAKQEEETTEAIEDENEALERQKELEEAVTDAEKELADAQKNLADAQKAVADAYEEIAEKEKAVLEVQNELNEAMYGTGDRRKSTLDGMYNYDQLIKQLTDDIADAKARLTNYESTDITGDINSYSQLVHNKKVMLLSQQQAYQSSLSTAKSLLSQYSAYYTEVNGRLLVDVAKLNSAAMPDKIKDQIESTINAYNDSVDKIHSITNDIKSLEKEFLDFQKIYRDKYIDLQEKVIQTLKEQAQEELNTEKEKYAALEEADNEYVNALEEAINKQRELRERANEEADLAQKEKKLSLMQRDTSGANQKDILKQQEDVDKTRQSLNDKKIDSIVKSLKDLYKTQKESRDAEIKYRETVLSNATFIEEANAVISSWQTADDLISWFMEHSTEVNTMTQEQLEKYSEELSQMYSDREIYMNTSIEDFTNMLNVTQSEINSMSSSVSETLSTEMQRAFAETRREVDKTIEELKDKLAQAEDAVVTAKDQLAQTLDKVAEEVNNVKTATENLAQASKDLANHLKDVKSAVDTLGTGDSSGGNAGGNSVGGIGTGNTGGSSSNHAAELTAYINKLKYKSPNSLEKIDSDFIADIEQILNELASYGKHFYYDKVKKELVFTKTYEDAKNHIEHAERAEDRGHFVAYKKGGLVNYTGPAWVDGTPAQPEAFLNTEDTKNIATFTNVLSNLLSLTPFQQNQSVDNSTTTTINVTVNVDSISDDYDVHDAVQKVKDEIVAAANRVGSTVILHQ